VYTPIVHYFSVENQPAKEEFESKVIQPLRQAVQALEYTSHFMTVSHAGYEMSTAVPVVLVVAKNLTEEDARHIIAVFDALSCDFINRCLCFSEETGTQVTSRRLQDYQRLPELGSSIGTKGGDSSFSLGLYFHFKDDPSTHYAVSAHHGLSKSYESMDSSNPIEVQQPSYPDYEDSFKEIETGLAEAREGGNLRNKISVKDWEEDLNLLKEQKYDFAMAEHSECKTTTHDGRTIWVDWVVMKVDPARLGSNLITYPVGKNVSRWYPRDGIRMFVVGSGEIRTGMRVVKAGRNSNATVGSVDFVHGHVQFEDTPLETQEYTIVAESYENVFSNKGDSGAGVIDEEGRICGFVLGGTRGAPCHLKGHEALGPLYASYITPFSAIKQRIESTAGREVIVDLVDLAELERNGVDIIRGYRRRDGK
jgi:hypothetical protein